MLLRAKFAGFFAVSFAIAGVSSAQRNGRAQSPPFERAVAFASLEAAAPLDDLAPLREVFAGARVVLLGEQTHGDGATFAAKIRLIRYLHEELDFDVLVFESGMFGCREAHRAFVKGELAPLAAAAQGIFPIWTRSRDLQPLWDYLAERAQSERPLRLAGYDYQITGDARQRMPDALAEVAKTAGLPAKQIERLVVAAHSVTREQSWPNWNREKAGVRRAFSDFERALTKTGAVGDEERVFWKRYSKSLLARVVEAAEHTESSSAPMHVAFNPRDLTGGENLIWLANERFAGRKIIVWLATMHAVRDAPGLDKARYHKVKTAGHVLAETLKDEAFVVGFTTAGGQAGLPWGKPWAIRAPSKDSFEAQAVAAGLTNALVPLRGLPRGHKFSTDVEARPLGNQPMRATWPKHLDALMFLAEMTPSRPIGRLEVAAQPFEFVPAIEKALASIAAREASGNAFANKSRLSSVAESWFAANSPDAERIEAEEAHWLAWLEDDSNPAPLKWRIHDLLAQMALKRDAPDPAIERWDAAIASYPDRSTDRPPMHDGIQHVAADAALARMRRDGVDDGMDWFAEQLATRKAFRFAFLGGLLAELGKPERRRLLKLIDKAYVQRGKTWKDERDNAESYRRDLR